MMKGEHASVERRFLYGAIAFATVVYLLQILTPIRLDTDSLRYMVLAISIADGAPAARVEFPSGYPAIIALLDRLGLGSPNWFIGMNVVFLAAGLWALWWIYRDRSESIRLWTVVICLFSVPLVRSIAMPHPEAIYFGLSLGAIAAMSAVTRSLDARNLFLLAGAILLSALAVTLRLAAISLGPPLLWAVYTITSEPGRRMWSRIAIALVLVVAMSAVCVYAIAISENGTVSRYFGESEGEVEKTTASAGQVSTGIAAHFVDRIVTTLRGMGELALNIPLWKFKFLKFYLPLIGLVPAVYLIRRRKLMEWRNPMTIYVICYILLLILWPYYASRLWMPILPLLVMHMATAAHARPLGGFTRILGGAYVAWFMLAGMAAMAYTTRISLSGAKFTARYGTAGGMASPGEEHTSHNAYARMIIDRFDADNAAWRELRKSPAPALPENRE